MVSEIEFKAMVKELISTAGIHEMLGSIADTYSEFITEQKQKGECIGYVTDCKQAVGTIREATAHVYSLTIPCKCSSKL